MPLRLSCMPISTNGTIYRFPEYNNSCGTALPINERGDRRQICCERGHDHIASSFYNLLSVNFIDSRRITLLILETAILLIHLSTFSHTYGNTGIYVVNCSLRRMRNSATYTVDQCDGVGGPSITLFSSSIQPAIRNDGHASVTVSSGQAPYQYCGTCKCTNHGIGNRGLSSGYTM